jgi:two-component system sensor kinase FixL
MVRSLASEKELSFRPTSLLVVLIAILCILAVVLASAHQLRQERALVEQSVKIENRSRVQSFEQFVLRTLAVADIALRHIQNHAARDLNGLGIHQSPTDPVINSPIFTASAISVPGKLYISTRPELKLTSSQLREIQALAWSNPQKAAVTAPLELQGLGQQVGVVRPLLEHPGGFAVVFLNPRRLTDYAENIPFGRHDLISLIGLDGITRARRTGDGFTNGERVKGLVMERQLAVPNGDYVGPSVLDGIPRYFSHQRLEGYRLFATSGIPTSTVDERMTAPEEHQLGLIAAAIAAILLGAGVILGSMHRNRMRVDDLVQANARLNEAQRIGSMGDWDYYPETDQLYWSDNLRRMYGRSSDEAVSNMGDVARYVSSRDQERIGRKIKRIFETGKSGGWEVKARLPGSDFSYRRVVAEPIFNADGKIVGVHGTDQDITPERMIREMEKKLAELARLDSMGALTATLAHELNQPLGIAANYLAAASRGIGRPGQSGNVQKYIQSAQAQIDHLAQIIAGARELVSHSDSTQQDIDLSVLTDELADLLHETVKRAPSRIVLELDEDAGHVCANKAQMKQVLFNLCRNAVEAVPQGAWPEIVIASTRQPDGMIRIDVRDNGQGFTDQRDDPFAALVTNKASGLGLGLALARTIVEHHGGKIWVKETGPNGTTIALTVPPAWEEGDTDDD